MKKFFVKTFEEILGKYTNMISIETLNNSQVKELTEFAFLLVEIINKLKLQVQEKILLERLLSKINDKLYIGEKIFYYSSLYYLPKKFYSGEPEEIGRSTYRANIDINIMRLQIKCGRVTGSSEDEYFFSRGKSGLLRAVNNLLDHSDDIEVLVPALYTLLNYSQTIMAYLESGEDLFNEESKELAEHISQTIYAFLKKTCVVQRVNRDFQLKFFMLNELRKYKELGDESFYVLDSEIDGFKTYKNVNKKIWAYLNYVYIRKNNFREEFKIDFEMNYYDKSSRLKDLEKIIVLRDCLLWLEVEKDITIDEIKIPMFEVYKKNNWFLLKDYFNGFDNLDRVIINDRDREVVKSLTDDKLREFVGKTMKNIDPNSVTREISKPHDDFEIVDMEVPIKSSFIYGTYYLCITFKSRQEIKRKIEEDSTYKIFRPFANYGDKAIVVFISTSEGTETFYNEIKKSTVNLNWTIQTIVGDTLVKLLKHNKLIV